jgi:hypothetical protein
MIIKELYLRYNDVKVIVSFLNHFYPDIFNTDLQLQHKIDHSVFNFPSSVPLSSTVFSLSPRQETLHCSFQGAVHSHSLRNEHVSSTAVLSNAKPLNATIFKRQGRWKKKLDVDVNKIPIKASGFAVRSRTPNDGATTSAMCQIIAFPEELQQMDVKQMVAFEDRVLLHLISDQSQVILCCCTDSTSIYTHK